MKIATNTPESFQARNGYTFTPLGSNESKDSSFIILMLEKNWGSASIDKINAIKYWVSTYPKDVPCYIIGCETTIPEKTISDSNFLKYKDKERDEAVRSLCDVVLERSNSIGVREEVTYLYLTNMLGYKKELVDIIYKKYSKNNLNLLRSFFDKNKINLTKLQDNIASFQECPKASYVQPKNYDKNIIITKPFITTKNETVRLNSEIKIDGVKNTLWCETNRIYKQFILVERSDAFLCALLPLAMRTRKDLLCEAPVSEQFLHNLNEVLIPNLCAHDPGLYKTKVIAKGDSTPLISGNAVATGMSCGVDSFFTTNLYKSSEYKSLNLTHLYCGNYLYGNNGPIFERAKSAASDLKMPLIKTATNISDFIKLPHLHTHFFKTIFGVLSLKKLFRTYFYSSAEDFSSFNLKNNSIRDTAEIELLLSYTFNSPSFQIITGGGGFTRLEKTKSICNFKAAQKHLNVCLKPNLKYNCGKCGKCLRTLFMLDMLDSLDNFRSVFDIDDYKVNRQEYFVHLVQQKKSKMLSPVYNYFFEHQKPLIQEAERLSELQK